jgi:hypothetical protein
VKWLNGSRATQGAQFLPGLIATVLCALPACSVDPGKAWELQTLRVGGVVHVGTRAEIKGTEAEKLLKSEGVEDAGIVDGSAIVVRMLCCREDLQNTSVITTRNSQGLKVADGDFVEIRLGGTATKDHKAELNDLTRVVQRAGATDGSCWWDPKREGLWMRVVYCEWMPQQGWVKQEGLMPGWYKPSGVTAENGRP